MNHFNEVNQQDQEKTDSLAGNESGKSEALGKDKEIMSRSKRPEHLSSQTKEFQAMSDNSSLMRQHQALSPPRSAGSRLPTGFRTVHVPVPESIFNHAKAQAYLSGLRFAEFVARLLSEARPYPGSRMPQRQPVPPAPQVVEAGLSQP